MVTCDWDTGTVYTGPSKCGRPAKWYFVEWDGVKRSICGIHKRSARNISNAEVLPLDQEGGA